MSNTGRKHRLPVQPNRKYRDSMFRFLFGNEKHRDWTLSLFNALSGKDYTDPGEIRYQEMDNVLYIQIREDVVFLYSSTLNFFEHQSTWSPNLPFRMLEYAARQFAAIADKNIKAVYSSRIVKFPKPRFFVLYNGTDRTIPAETTLKLSESYDTISRSEELGNAFDLEVVVHVFNINSGFNESLQEKCRPLKEYTWIVSAIRKETARGRSLKDAIRMVIRRIPESFLIRDEIMAERGRVTAMIFDEEWNARQMEKLRNELREEAREEARKEALEEGIIKNKSVTAKRMVLKGYNDAEILELTDISPENLASIREETAKSETA